MVQTGSKGEEKMKVSITPGKAKGVVLAPPSKSMAHRVLICAGLSEGESIIDNIELSEDIQATLGMLEALGATYRRQNRRVIINGIGHREPGISGVLDSKESGSTLRFFIPIVLAKGQECHFTGAKRLFERPLGVYEKLCKEQAIVFEKREEGLYVKGQLEARKYQIPGDVSSQFITGLLFALPLLETDSILEILPPIESKPYIHMTIEALQMFGINIQQDGNVFQIPGNQVYQKASVTVEGDYSNAAFLEAFNLLDGDVKVEGLREDSLQGDKVYRQCYEELQTESPVIDLTECPDLGPILMGMAATKHGARFVGTRRLKMKESDRGTVMAEELRKFGIRVDVGENEIIVCDGELKLPSEILCGHNDHRIVMTLATICTMTGGTIEGAEAVKKSFPSYFDVISDLGVQIAREA